MRRSNNGAQNHRRREGDTQTTTARHTCPNANTVPTDRHTANSRISNRERSCSRQTGWKTKGCRLKRTDRCATLIMTIPVDLHAARHCAQQKNTVGEHPSTTEKCLAGQPSFAGRRKRATQLQSQPTAMRHSTAATNQLTSPGTTHESSRTHLCLELHVERAGGLVHERERGSVVEETREAQSLHNHSKTAEARRHVRMNPAAPVGANRVCRGKQIQHGSTHARCTKR